MAEREDHGATTHPVRASAVLVNNGPGRGLWEYRVGDAVRHPPSGREGVVTALRGWHELEVEWDRSGRCELWPASQLVPVLPSRRLPAEVVEVMNARGVVLLARQVLAGLGDREAQALRQSPEWGACKIRVRLIEAA